MNGPIARGMRIAGVPLLLATPGSAALSGPLPTVLWFHGFRADALAHAAELERCAAAGFLAVGVDAVGHGARLDQQLGARVAASPGGALPVVRELIEATLHELPALVDELVATHHADRARLSAVGISMGAFLVYRAISSVSAPRLRSAVALLGSPEWPGAHSAHTRLDAFADVPLLSITAEHDASVPPAAATRFHELLAGRVGDTGSHAQHAHHVLRGAGHLANAEEWSEAMHETMRWLDRFAR